MRSRPGRRVKRDVHDGLEVHGLVFFRGGPELPLSKGGNGVGIQLIIDVGIDPAGNVWAANNWNAIEPVVADVTISRA